MGVLLSVAIGSLLAVVVGVIGYTTNQEVTDIFDRSSHDAREIAAENAARFAELLAANTAVTVQPSVVDHNYSYIRSVLSDLTRTDTNLLYIAVFDAEGALIEASGEVLDDEARVLTATAPIVVRQEKVGRIDLVYSLSSMETRIEAAQDRSKERRSSSIRTLLVGGGLVLGFGVLIAAVIGMWLSRPVARMAQAAAALGEGDFEVRVDVGGPTEIQQLATTFNSMAGELKASVEASIEQAALEHEVATARRLQREMMPSEARIVTGGGLEIASWYTPTGKMGGDWWTISETTPGTPINLMIGDVMGHGIPAALFTAAAKSAYRTASVIGADESPDALLTTVDTALRDFSKTHTMSCCAVRLDLASRQIVLSLGGHPPPLRFRSDAGETSLAVLEGRGPLLGDPDPVGPFTCSSHAFEPGDVIALFTDGLIEAVDARDRMYGLRRLGAIISAHVDEDLDGILDAIKQSFYEYVDLPRLDDDVTVVLIRYLRSEDRAQA
ncbi:MAG TPA: SpoIIE family protein phosphatase [Kofleriaceae bacterium]|nr:SpoIIE family protein phosphatase [Kofleriaceae bacterium]